MNLTAHFFSFWKDPCNFSHTDRVKQIFNMNTNNTSPWHQLIVGHVLLQMVHTLVPAGDRYTGQHEGRGGPSPVEL